MKRYKYKVTITFATKDIVNVCNLMDKLDVSVGKMGIQQTWEFTSLVDDNSIIKTNIERCFSECECEVYSIEVWRGE